MKAITINEFGGTEQLTLAEVPTPVSGCNEVLIRVKAAGVNPVDCKIREGRLAMRLPHRFPLIPGWDAAGIVVETGPGVTSFKLNPDPTGKESEMYDQLREKPGRYRRFSGDIYGRLSAIRIFNR